MMFLLATAAATTFELEAGSTLRQQQAGALVSEDLYVYTTSAGFTSGGRLRLESDDAHVGLEMFGAADKLALLEDGVRSQRWGGARVLFGFEGRTPLTTTLTHFRLGAVTWDVRDVGEEAHEPLSFGSIGIEVRRFTRNRFQSLEGDFMLNDGLWAGELRTKAGISVFDTGLYLTIGGATSRFSAFDPAKLTQVTYQLETSVLWRSKK